MESMVEDHIACWNGIRRLYAGAPARRVAGILRLDRHPVIIGGCGRSGTTLLQAVLSCHPAMVAVAEETRAFCPGGYLPTPTLQAPFKFTKLYHQLIRCEVPDDAMGWCEKTPKNILYFQRILRFFGERVRLIQIVRDGRDVVVSRHPADPAKFWVTPRRWVTDVRAGLQWTDHPRVLTIRYEDLIEAYASTVRRLCRFIGIPVVPGFDDFPRHARLRRNAAWSGPVRPLYKETMGAWKHPANQERIADLLATPGAEELLHHYGYVP